MRRSRTASEGRVDVLSVEETTQYSPGTAAFFGFVQQPPMESSGWRVACYLRRTLTGEMG
jgi:hypothetical protein